MSQPREAVSNDPSPINAEVALMARACRAVSHVFSLDADTRDEWASSVARDLCELVPMRASALVMVCEWVAPAGEWRTITLGIAGHLGESAERAVREQAARGWPDDDVSRTLGHAARRARAVCARREEMLPDDLWHGCAFERFRRSIGVHDFARALVPIDECGQERAMVLQLDGLQPAWRAPREAMAALACVMGPTAEAYKRKFVEPTLARRRVLESLSPMQRAIAPLLAEGLSETQVAERIHRSAHTVHDHTRAIYKALGVRSRLELRDMWLGRTK